MLKRLTILAVSVLLTACAALGLETTEQKIQAGCASITSSVQVLTVYKDRLSESQVQAVEATLNHTYPICGQGNVPTADDVALAAINAAQAELAKLADEVRKP